MYLYITGAGMSYLVYSTDVLKDLISVNSVANNGYADEIVFYITPTIAVATLVATLFNKSFILHKMIFDNKSSAIPSIKKEVKIDGKMISNHAVSFCSALIFGLGLGYSGMCNTDRVINFLNFSGSKGKYVRLFYVYFINVCIRIQIHIMFVLF